MRFSKYVLCAVCVCGVGLFAGVGLTQDRPAGNDDDRFYGNDDDGFSRNKKPIEEPVARNPGRALPPPDADEVLDEFGTREFPTTKKASPESLPRDQRIENPVLQDRLFDEPNVLPNQNPLRRRLATPEYGETPPARENLGWNRNGDSATPMRVRIISRTVKESIYEPVPVEEVAAAKKLNEAIAALRNGKNDAEREKATLTIQEQLQFQFERDLKQREKELKAVEERVRALREQLDKRKAAQADIIKLRKQTIVNEATGLGFPGASFSLPQIPADSAFYDDGSTFEEVQKHPELGGPRRPRTYNDRDSGAWDSSPRADSAGPAYDPSN